MCRFVAYLGLPIIIEEVLFETKNSLIRQSMHARESEIVLNGDGFGLGWYNHDIDLEPGLFKSTQPAWNDENLQSLSAKIRSTCFFAHVRAASTGSVSPRNCHPFAYGQTLFMHNGGLGGFSQIKRHIRHLLSDEVYDWIKGDTDSEHLAALIFDNMRRHKSEKGLTTVESNLASIEQAILSIEDLQREHKITEPNYINAVLTTGKFMIAIRYVSNPKSERASSLHYAVGDRYEAQSGGFTMKNKSSLPSTIFITSERLDNHRANWEEVKTNHFLVVNSLNEIMQIPVKVRGRHAKSTGKKGFALPDPPITKAAKAKKKAAGG